MAYSTNQGLLVVVPISLVCCQITSYFPVP